MTYCLLLAAFAGRAQSRMDVMVSLSNEPVVLDQAMNFENTQVTFSQVRIYLSHVEFYQGDSLIAKDNTHAYLIDLADDSTQHLSFGFPLQGADRVQFLLGIDSASSTSGAMDQALDPMYGMYWSWQSGYINCKIEGTFPGAGQDFQLHLGGYMAPFSAARQCTLRQKGISGYSDTQVFRLRLDLAPLIGRIRQENRPVHVMSPGANAVAYSKLIADALMLMP